MGFPKKFIWGVATSAYQIEGAVREDGKGPHIWDVFSAMPGYVLGNQTGAVACDHYHRFRSDVAEMGRLGIGAYRFSVDWSRVMPAGRGPVNQRGLDFYDALTDALLEAGIEPYVTLFHWELPYALYEQGGWMNPDIVEWFGDYAAAVAGRLGVRVGGSCPEAGARSTSGA